MAPISLGTYDITCDLQPRNLSWDVVSNNMDRSFSIMYIGRGEGMVGAHSLCLVFPNLPLRCTSLFASLLPHPLKWSSIETRFTSRVFKTSTHLKRVRRPYQHLPPTNGRKRNSTKTTGTPLHLSIHASGQQHRISLMFSRFLGFQLSMLSRNRSRPTRPGSQQVFRCLDTGTTELIVRDRLDHRLR